MSITKKTLEVDCFHNENGDPVCAIDFSRADGICRFLYTKKFGTKFTCIYTGEQIDRTTGGETGFLTPCDDCPLNNVSHN